MPRALVLVLLALPLAGCLEAREEVRLEVDGRGTLRQTFVTDPARGEGVAAALLLLTGGGDASALARADPFHPEWLRSAARAAAGYEIEKAERTVGEDGRRTTVALARFASLEAAAHGGAFHPCAVRLLREEDGSWRLVLEDAWKVATDATGGRVAGEGAAALLASLESTLGSLRIERTITFPSRVLRTNGALDPDGRTVRWRVDFDRLRRGEDLSLEVRFADGDGLGLVTFRHAPDLDALARRLTEEPPQPAVPEGDAAPR